MTPVKPFEPRVRILANAGSGKTYSLVTRCIQLLNLGAAPRSILALTFTRAAAGEFLRDVFLRLAGAAEKPDKLAKLQEDLQDATVDRAKCLGWLRSLIQELPRLSMGTIDQFFSRILGAFPFEAGIGGDFRLLQDHALEEARIEGLARFLREKNSNGALQDELAEILRDLQSGKDAVTIWDTLLDAISKGHEKVLDFAGQQPWGTEVARLVRAHRFSPGTDTAQVVKNATKDFLQEVRKLYPDLHEDVQQMLHDLEKDVGWLSQSNRLNDNLKGWFLRRLTWKTPKDGSVYLQLGREKILRIHHAESLDGKPEALRSALWCHELSARLHYVAGLYHLLRLFEEEYALSVRSQGWLTFADITRLLEGLMEDHTHSVAYRLDHQFKHIVLDEFQDTSRLQWNILKNLADEIIQDSEGDRSFFYVGDTKQSIYGWRQGDDRLFQEIFEYYNQNRAGHIAEDFLKISRRSDRNILTVVNALFAPFASEDSAPDFKFSPDVAQRWSQAWVEHLPRPEAGEGYVAYIEYPKPESDSKKTSKAKTAHPPEEKKKIAQPETSHSSTPDDGSDQEVDEAVAKSVEDILQRVRPWERGISCGILARNNDYAEAMAKHLRECHIPVRLQGRAPTIQRNPETYALYQILRVVALHHDPKAEAFLHYTPWRILLGEGGNPAAQSIHFRESARRLAADRGFHALLAEWVERGVSQGLLAEEKVAGLLAAVEEFDQTRGPGDGWLALINFLESHQSEDPLTTDAVQVMTIHKSKGLTLDMVLLVSLHKSFKKAPHHPELTEYIEGKVVRDLLVLPSEDFCLEDDFLADIRATSIGNGMFEEICCFYVAATRARHALYLVGRPHKLREPKNSLADWTTKFFPESKSSPYSTRLKHEATPELNEESSSSACLREIGNANWFEQFPLTEKTVAVSTVAEGHPATTPPVPHAEATAKAPSSGSFKKIPAKRFLVGRENAELGSEVHALLAQVLWRDQEPAWASPSPRALEVVGSFLKSAEADFLDPSTEKIAVWREKAFVVRLDGKTINGVFDRVHIHQDEKGTPLRAEVYDYKTTDSKDGLEERYAEQMSSYRAVAASLLGLPQESVLAKIIPVQVLP